MKKKLVISVLLVVITTLCILESCRKHDGEFSRPTPLAFKIPEGWPAPERDIFQNNPLTEQGFQLGKRLFYDGILSKDGGSPCSSCHQPVAAFGTFNHDLSHGYNHSHTKRNAPPLFNLAWMREMNWDGGSPDLESVSLAQINDIIFMGENTSDVVNKLLNHPEYPGLFKAAFGSSGVNAERLSKALAQFVGSFISAESKYDKVKRGEASFNVNEAAGYLVYKARCANCHTEPLFTDFSYRNNGLPKDGFLQDNGRMNVTGNSSDSLKFRVPSLRNTGFTYPYMHDGRKISLQKIVDHYGFERVSGPGVDTSILNKPAFTPTEKFQLITFLETLNDSSFLTNPRYLQ